MHAINCLIGSILAAELWAQLWRKHSNQETAAAIESYHNVTKVLSPLHVKFLVFTEGSMQHCPHELQCLWLQDDMNEEMNSCAVGGWTGFAGT